MLHLELSGDAKLFKLILVAPDLFLYEAFQKYFANFPDVEIINDGFQWVTKYDCLVSPANSFGMMDGGMDAAIIDFFGRSLEDKVQQRILDDYLGEQAIGTSLIVETEHLIHPFLAHTPIMRVPMNIQGTDIPYVAMWAMLLAVRQYNQKLPHSII